MSFDEVQFPLDIARGAMSETRRSLDVVTLRSGHEQRNTAWADSRKRFNVGTGMRQIADSYEVLEFWEARRGGLRGFRFKDWADFKSLGPSVAVSNTDQEMGAVTASVFQLQKTYSAASNPWVRTIGKPVSGTVVVTDDTGALMVSDADFTVNYEVGLVAFGLATVGTPTAGFEFDMPARFEADTLEISVALSDIGQTPNIQLVELRRVPATQDQIDDLQNLALYNWLQAVDINTAVNINWNATWGTL